MNVTRSKQFCGPQQYDCTVQPFRSLAAGGAETLRPSKQPCKRRRAMQKQTGGFTDCERKHRAVSAGMPVVAEACFGQ